MGCCGSTSPPLAQGGAKGLVAGAKPPARAQKKLNPKDFVISKKCGEAIVKMPGTIDGEQFNIEECKDCDIFLLDNIATAFIDDCERCRIFVGPVESSVMLRNCRSCELVIACQQFRSRDCADCRFALFCTTEPIIETSTDMQFACFDFNYFSLRQQLNRAGLKLWNNKWWQVYDFNKNPDRPNWSLLPQEDVPRLLRMEACADAIALDELQMEKVVPVTLGSRPWPSEESAFLAFLPDSEAYIEAFIAKTEKAPGWSLARGRCTVLSEERLKALFAWAREPKLAAQCRAREVTGIEVCGPGIFRQVQYALAATGLAAGSKSIRLVPQEETAALAKAFFEAWKDEV